MKKEETTGRLRIEKRRVYDGDRMLIDRRTQQEWMVWPDPEGSPDYCWEEWRDLPEVWEGD